MAPIAPASRERLMSRLKSLHFFRKPHISSIFLRKLLREEGQRDEKPEEDAHGAGLGEPVGGGEAIEKKGRGWKSSGPRRRGTLTSPAAEAKEKARAAARAGPIAGSSTLRAARRRFAPRLRAASMGLRSRVEREARTDLAAKGRALEASTRTIRLSPP